MLKKLTGAIRRLLNPATDETVAVNETDMTRPEARARSASVRPPLRASAWRAPYPRRD